MKAYKKTERKYYKYQYNTFAQPTLTSNGVMGGKSFAVSASSDLNSGSQAWSAFDNSALSDKRFWHSASGHPSWIQFYNPNPLNVSAIKITNRSVDGAMINAYGISYSDDGANFTEFKTGNSTNQTLGGSFSIDTSGNGYHKYWRITSKSSSGQNNGYTAIDEIDITAQEQKSVETANGSHDYYEDIITCKLPKINGTYYGIGD